MPEPNRALPNPRRRLARAALGLWLGAGIALGHLVPLGLPSAAYAQTTAETQDALPPEVAEPAEGETQPVDLCQEAIGEAEAQIAQANLDEAISLLSRCVNREGLTATEVVPAYRLLAQSYLSAGDEEEAKLVLVRLLSLDPAYEADPTRDPFDYGAFVGEVKRELELPTDAHRRCDYELAAAQEHYEQDHYDEAVRVLSDCLSKPELLESAAVEAYRLSALVHMRQGALAEARTAVVAILAVEPDYEADPVRDLPAYRSLVHIVRRQVAEAP